MQPIEKLPFGRTGHRSSRTVFGSFCLKNLSQESADRVLELLFRYEINHIDTAPGYGDAELRIGPWMKQNRNRFFLATKTDKRTYAEAREQFHRSLDRLQADRVDLLQLHNLTDVVGREVVMGPAGALEFLIEAKQSGLARFIGVTGHGILAPGMHRQSLAQYPFDSVLLPCNYLLMQNPYYAGEFDRLLALCRKQATAVQTIKSAARGLWGERTRTCHTWYEPLNGEEAITRAVHWALGIPDTFLVTPGEASLLPMVLSAAANYQGPPSDEAMRRMVEQEGMSPLFDQA
jgi:aryl-alcohol dehydrogenase-like predicted oxidoreductase